jgi:hypothetical protein
VGLPSRSNGELAGVNPANPSQREFRRDMIDAIFITIGCFMLSGLFIFLYRLE